MKQIEIGKHIATGIQLMIDLANERAEENETLAKRKFTITKRQISEIFGNKKIYDFRVNSSCNNLVFRVECDTITLEALLELSEIVFSKEISFYSETTGVGGSEFTPTYDMYTIIECKNCIVHMDHPSVHK